MGGAFVAVADDATATYWNPAGLAFGGLFSTVVDRAELEGGVRDAPETPQLRASSTFIGLTSLPLGLSYYRLSETTARAEPQPVPGRVALQSLVTQHAGVTLVQSILPDLAVGTTIKLVRGRAAHAVVGDAGPEPIEAAEDLPTRSSTAFDLDVGAMVSMGALRVGMLVRNVREPTFEAPDEASLSLSRQARLGVALVARHAWAFAVDADLRRVDTPLGERRDVSAGIERWLLGRRLGLRGGVRVNTAADDRKPVGSVGASLHVTPTLAIEAHWADSDAPADRSWSIGARSAF
ncbi:MAG: hypothetical protein GEU99_21770 [Luteitalea sp.]|nr:hypothetical protein [Luteitalea sp.]